MNGSSAAARATTKVGRNDPCACGSGKKFKHCCQSKDASAGAGSPSSSAQRQRLQALFLAAKTHWDAGRLADAIPQFKEIARLDPNSPQAHHDLGVLCLQCGRLAEAAASLRRAVQLRPSFESALQHLVGALELDGHASEALLVCRKLSRTAADPIERRHHLAKAFALAGKLEEAEKELCRVLVLAPENAGSRALLGQILSLRGKFDEAARHLTEVIDVVPIAFLQLTVAKRMTDADRPLMDRMRALVERPVLDASQRLSVLFGLGKAFDDLQEYPEAMRCYEEANRLRAATGHFDHAELAARYDRIIATFDANALARAERSLARTPRPGDDLPVFVVGMPRSGTTLVEQILSSHPAVAGGGELTFWSDLLSGSQGSTIEPGSVEAGRLSRIAETYRALLRRHGPHALRVTDKLPRNFEALGLIRVAFPEARVIHCRRCPVDTCLSIFFTNFSGSHPYASDRGNLVFYYRQYERLMEHWRRVLPADRFTEVDYETLIADREAETRRLIAFCRLEWDNACLAPERNPRTVKTASVWQARQPVYKTSVERWRRYEPWLGELQQLLPAAAEAGA